MERAGFVDFPKAPTTAAPVDPQPPRTPGPGKCPVCEGTGSRRTYSTTGPDPVRCENCGGTGNVSAAAIVAAVDDILSDHAPAASADRDEHHAAPAPAYPFKMTDAGRSASKRPKQKNDCTVRALAIACRLAYDVAYEYLAGEGRKCTQGFHLQKLLNKIAAGKLAVPLLASNVTKIPFPAVKGERRMTPPEFCRLYPRGRYIVRKAGHVFAVIDGVLHDDHAVRPNACIYTAWRIE